MQLKDVANDYLAFIRYEQGVSDKTVYCYTSWARHFIKWVEEQGQADPSIESFNTPTLRRYLYYLSGERKHRPRTLRGAFLPLRGMGKFCVRNGILTDDPNAPIVLPKKDAAIRETVTTEEVKTLLDGCERQRNARQVALCRCVFALLTYSGLRRTELLDLYVTDIGFEDRSVLVRCGKGSKSRTVYVPQNCLDAVREWLRFRPSDCSHLYLLCIDRSRRMQDRGLDTVFRDVKQAAGLGNAKHVTPHVLRHWRATDLLASGADLRSIQAFLGHSTLQVTALYLHTDEQRTRNLANLSALSTETVSKDTGERSKPDKGRLRRVPR